ncbi:MAG: tRNA (N6-threonylcarbamoyladenosine(37)-N6)-methyltransferase TrmO [Pseudobdellovibrionaceae bacterium]
MHLKPIGSVQSCFKQKFGTPRQSGIVSQSVAEIVIDPLWQPELSLTGLSQYSHLWVIFGFHQNGNYEFHGKVHPPRLKGESVGLFATRSPHRPNPLGLSVVQIIRVLKDRILVRGVDIIDQTPVYDIKPYLPQVEALTDAKAELIESNPEQSVQVGWTLEALADLESCFSKSEEVQKFSLGQTDLKKLIEDVVAQDPRPLVYRGFEGEKSPYREIHFFRLFDLDIHFKFDEALKASVIKLKIFTDL